MTAPAVDVALCSKGLHPRTPETTDKRGRCRPCSRENCRRYYARNSAAVLERQRRHHTENADAKRERERQHRERLVAETHAAYGGRCAVPDCDVAADLELHHVNGDGRAHRQELLGHNVAGWKFYAALRRAGFPRDGLELLCAKHHRNETNNERKPRNA